MAPRRAGRASEELERFSSTDVVAMTSSPGWRRDVVTGHRAMTTTGGNTWDAAFRLCDYLEAEWETLSGQGVPEILELGAGTGWLGLTLARNGLASLCLTEQAEGGAMEWLQENLDEAAPLLPANSVRLEELDWTKLGTLPKPTSGSWHLLLGSDLIYNEVGVKYLPLVLRSFVDKYPEITMLYCHTLHRFDDFDLQFCRALLAQGLAYRIIAAEGATRPEEAGDDMDPLADDEAGYLEELFPEQRVVVFHIVRGGRSFLPWSSSLAHNHDAESPSLPAGALAEEAVVQVGRLKILLPSAEELGDESIRLVNLGPFGSGEHPTTALMLRAMQEMSWTSDMVVCDYGCGSGLLALAALRLGAGHCLAVDNVPDALVAAQQNAEANNCQNRISLHLPPEEMLQKDLDFFTRHGDGHAIAWRSLVPQEVDVVLANIVTGPLCHCAQMIARLLRPNDQVLLAGMRKFQVEQVREAYHAFALEELDSIDGWVILRGRRT